MIRSVKTIKQGRKYRINKFNEVWCLIYDLFQINNINRIIDFFFKNDTFYLIIEFVDEDSKKQFLIGQDVLFDRNKKVCVTLSVIDLQNIIFELINSAWNSDDKKIYCIYIVDMVCDICAIKELIEQNKDIPDGEKKRISTIHIDADDPFRIVCTFDIEDYSSKITKNRLGNYYIELPFDLDENTNPPVILGSME